MDLKPEELIGLRIAYNDAGNKTKFGIVRAVTMGGNAVLAEVGYGLKRQVDKVKLEQIYKVYEKGQ